MEGIINNVTFEAELEEKMGSCDGCAAKPDTLLCEALPHGCFSVGFIWKMKKPKKEKYGYQNGGCFEESGWLIEGGEEAYFEALKKWQFMQDKGLGDEDIINDITYPHEL